MDDMERPGLMYPNMREELLEDLDGLADLDYQQKVWVRGEPHPGIQHDELDYALHFLFDDTDLAESPEKSIGVFLLDKEEARVVHCVTQALDALLTQYGVDLSDARYLAKPEWTQVVDRPAESRVGKGWVST